MDPLIWKLTANKCRHPKQTTFQNPAEDKNLSIFDDTLRDRHTIGWFTLRPTPHAVTLYKKDPTTLKYHFKNSYAATPNQPEGKTFEIDENDISRFNHHTEKGFAFPGYFLKFEKK